MKPLNSLMALTSLTTSSGPRDLGSLSGLKPANSRNLKAVLGPTLWKCLDRKPRRVSSSVSAIMRLTISTSTPLGWGLASLGGEGISSTALRNL